LAAIFSDGAIEKVFHAAEYDVMCLRRDFGYEFVNLFDTMWAARILGWPKVGLGDILKGTFDVRTNKRYQRYNWGQRPLDREALNYASLDTHYLLALRRLQARALHQRNRWDEAQEAFESVANSDSPPRAFDAQDFWRIKGAARLPKQQQAVLRQLFIWRDREARHRNTPPFKILGNSALVALAKTLPQSTSDLRGIRGLRPHHVRRFGDRILRAVKLGVRSRPPQPPPRPPRRPYRVTERFRALRAWRSDLAARRGVDPDVVLSNAALWALSERAPKELSDLENIEGLGRWKRNEYGSDLLRILGGR
jgi:ribonuclease D